MSTSPGKAADGGAARAVAPGSRAGEASRRQRPVRAVRRLLCAGGAHGGGSPADRRRLPAAAGRDVPASPERGTAGLGGPADVADARGGAVGAVGGGGVDEARGPHPHRRPQDQQRHRPGAACPGSGRGAGRRRDRCGATWRGGGRRLCPAGPAVRGLHGRGGCRAPGPERGPHAPAGRHGGPGHLRGSNPAGRHR